MASRRLRKSQNSDCDTSLRKSSSKKRKSSSRRRKKTPEEPTTQSYELFASRHLRKLTDAAQQPVNVNTKYELTAANTSKLWSKFEQDLLGKPNPISNSGATGAKPLDIFDQGIKFAAQATFAPHDPDMSEVPLDESNAL